MTFIELSCSASMSIYPCRLKLMLFGDERLGVNISGPHSEAQRSVPILSHCLVSVFHVAY